MRKLFISVIGIALVITCLNVFGLPSQAKGNIKFWVDMVQFSDKSGKVYVAFNIKVPADNLTMQKTGEGYSSKFQFDVKILNVSQKEVDKVSLTSSAMSNVEKTEGKVFFSCFNTFLVPGKYEIQIIITDSKNTKNKGTLVEKFEVKSFSNDFTISDILLSSLIRSADPKDDKFVFFDTFYVLPNPDRVFTKSLPLNLYFEIYNIAVVNDQINLLVECFIDDERGDPVFYFADYISNKVTGTGIMKAYDSRMFFPFMNYAVKNPGKFTLRLKLEDQNSGKTVEKEIELGARAK